MKRRLFNIDKAFGVANRPLAIGSVSGLLVAKYSTERYELQFFDYQSGPPEVIPSFEWGHRWWNRIGFACHTIPSTKGDYFFLAVPDYAIGFVTALLPCFWLVRYVRDRRRFRAGICQCCGYDVRATPDRCPECGRAPERSVTVSV